MIHVRRSLGTDGLTLEELPGLRFVRSFDSISISVLRTPSHTSVITGACMWMFVCVKELFQSPSSQTIFKSVRALRNWDSSYAYKCKHRHTHARNQIREEQSSALKAETHHSESWLPSLYIYFIHCFLWLYISHSSP